MAARWFGAEYERRRQDEDVLERLAKQVIRMFMAGRLSYREILTLPPQPEVTTAVERLCALRAGTLVGQCPSRSSEGLSRISAAAFEAGAA